MLKSFLWNFANMCIEGRFSILPLLALFPTAGLLLASTSTIIDRSIMHYQK
ncbi:MAG TPA: hypothetical protein VFP45_02070 [Candidatus Nitrosotalea sp.]|nr:hypothetical protein [Candidatus Nitrosotalea sp.]